VAGQAGIEAVQSARLLRIQQAREQRARTEAADAAAAREGAQQALDAAVRRRHDAAQAVTGSARGRWDAVVGLQLSSTLLTMLRDAEAAERDEVRRLGEAVTEAEQLLVWASRHAAAAAGAAMVQATSKARREQLANRCAARLQRSLLRAEEATSEDDLAGKGVNRP